MKVPEKVKIGPYIYSVEFTDGPIIVNGRECKGSIDYEALEIKILNGLAKQVQEQTFMHEVYHGIIRLYGIGFREWDEENIIDWTAQGFYQFILDNPKIFSE